MSNHIDTFKEVFNKSTIADFRKYLAPFNVVQVTKWMIYSDYCIDDDSKLYNSITFTVIPYIEDIQVLKERIGSVAPKDLKKTKMVDEQFGYFVKSGYVFNFAFVFEKGEKHFFGKSSKEEYLHQLDQIKNQFELWIQTTPHNQEYYRTVLKRVTNLRREMERKTFNVKLFHNIIILQFLIAFLMFTLTKECSSLPEKISWFSDRDDMVTAYGNIISDLFFMNYHLFCESENIYHDNTDILYSGNDTESKILWYDEIIRIADYVSGALAGRNYLPQTKDKYDVLFENAIADNPYLSVIAFHSEDNKFRINRIGFHHTNNLDV